LRGIAPDSGLYVPETFPEPDAPLYKLLDMDYNRLAYGVMKPFLPDFNEDELMGCVSAAYGSKFDTPLIAPLADVAGVNFLELFHGPTLAFKDMALSILPRLMTVSAKKNELFKKIIILVSTSGDTGKAALEGFANVEDTAIIVLYPVGKVSKVQELQMTTTEGENTFVLGVEGNFDDCQTTMKGILTNPGVLSELDARGAVFSSANSINIGRLVPQVVYYFHAYAQMVKKGALKMGEALNFTVPTGNFGNILAGYYAKKMGLPVGRLICASNENNVLSDFFNSGTYDKNRPFISTASPSMDILVSSNLERLLYHISGDSRRVKTLMDNLNKTGAYGFDVSGSEFEGVYATQDDMFSAIGDVFRREGYVMDTHTAVAYAAYAKYIKATGDDAPNVILSTASPFKFAFDVLKGIDGKDISGSNMEFGWPEKLAARIGADVPARIKNLETRPVRHRSVRKKEDVADYIKDFINNIQTY
jgi:threonine synthase